MKALLIALSVFIMAVFVQPVINITFAQNCVCAECGYPCKSPMVHASNCKYKNNKVTEEKSEDKSFNKGMETEAFDTEYQLMMIHSAVRSISGNPDIQDAEKDRLISEQSEILEKLKPENEVLKMMQNDILKEIDKVKPGIKKARE